MEKQRKILPLRMGSTGYNPMRSVEEAPFVAWYWRASDWGTAARVVEVLRKTDRMAGPAQHRRTTGDLLAGGYVNALPNRELRISK
jgi:hypothetical protein